MQRCVSNQFDAITKPRRKLTRDKLYGLETDLNITDNQYLIALTVFFFPYALFEVCIFTPLENIAVN